MNIKSKVFKKMLTKLIKHHIKRIIHNYHVRFIPGMQGQFNTYKSINVIHFIDHKSLMIISTHVEKAFDKIQHPLMIKTLNKLCIQEIYSNIIKAIYEKPTANIITNCKRLKLFLQVRNKVRMTTLTTSTKHSNRTFSQSNQAKERNKRCPNQKRRRVPLQMK